MFYTFIAQLKKSIDRASPSPTHRFLKTLDAKRKLLRSYTQNFDGLEERAGLIGSSSNQAVADEKACGRPRANTVRNIQLHGNIHRVRCIFCSAQFPCTAEHIECFSVGLAPDCPECQARGKSTLPSLCLVMRVGSAAYPLDSESTRGPPRSGNTSRHSPPSGSPLRRAAPTWRRDCDNPEG